MLASSTSTLTLVRELFLLEQTAHGAIGRADHHGTTDRRTHRGGSYVRTAVDSRCCLSVQRSITRQAVRTVSNMTAGISVPDGRLPSIFGPVKLSFQYIGRTREYTEQFSRGGSDLLCFFVSVQKKSTYYCRNAAYSIVLLSPYTVRLLRIRKYRHKITMYIVQGTPKSKLPITFAYFSYALETFLYLDFISTHFYYSSSGRLNI